MFQKHAIVLFGFFFATFFATHSFTKAMEDPNKPNPSKPISNEDLQEFHSIVREAFQDLPQYTPEAEVNSLTLASEKVESIGKAGIFSFLSRDVVVHILKLLHDNPRSQFAFAQTCRLLHVWSLPVIREHCLNAYCLQEGIPQSMPVELLRQKVRNTKDGVLKVARLLSVEPQDLASWFDETLMACVESCLPVPNPIQFHNLTEEQIVELLPKLKILVVAYPKIRDQGLRSSLESFFIEVSQTQLHLRGMRTFSQRQLFALNLNHPVNQISGSLYSLFSWRDQLRELDDVNPDVMEVMADLKAFSRLMQHSATNIPDDAVAVLASGYFGHRPAKRLAALNCLEWIWTHCEFKNGLVVGSSSPDFFTVCDAALGIYGRDYHTFKRTQKPSFITQILRASILEPEKNYDQPNMNEPWMQAQRWQSKVRYFGVCDSDPQVEEEKEKFVAFLQDQWQEDHWRIQLEPYTRSALMGFLIRAGIKECIPSMYADLMKTRGRAFNQMQDPDDDLLRDFALNGFEDLARQHIKRLLTEKNSLCFLPRIMNVLPFTRLLLRLDDGTFLPLMNAQFGREYQNWSLEKSCNDQAAFLIGLATSENPEDHLNYIKAKANAICVLLSDFEMKPKMCAKLAYLFCVLADNERSMNYYQEWVDAMLKEHPIEQSIHLQSLIDNGIDISSLEALRAMDPFEVLSKLAATNDRWFEQVL